jgi:hypothetical protein
LPSCKHENFWIMKEVKRGNDHHQRRLCKECFAVWTYGFQSQNEWNERIGPVSQEFCSFEGHCGKCKTIWSYVRGHVTSCDEHSGCTPLCELCWSELTPEERLPYYKKLYKEWKKNDKALWKKIKNAVLEGK